MKTTKVELRSKDGFLSKPIVNGVELDNVANVKALFNAMGVPTITIEVWADFEYVGEANVEIKKVTPIMTMRRRDAYLYGPDLIEAASDVVLQRTLSRFPENTITSTLAMDRLEAVLRSLPENNDA